MVALNTSTATRRIDVPLLGRLADGTVLEDPWSRVGGKVEAGRFGPIELPPRSARIVATPATGR